MSGDASAPSMVPSDIRRTKFVKHCPVTGIVTSVLKISVQNSDSRRTRHHIGAIVLEMNYFNKFVDIYESGLERRRVAVYSTWEGILKQNITERVRNMMVLLSRECLF